MAAEFFKCTHTRADGTSYTVHINYDYVVMAAEMRRVFSSLQGGRYVEAEKDVLVIGISTPVHGIAHDNAVVVVGPVDIAVALKAIDGRGRERSPETNNDRCVTQL